MYPPYTGVLLDTGALSNAARRLNGSESAGHDAGHENRPKPAQGPRASPIGVNWNRDFRSAIASPSAAPGSGLLGTISGTRPIRDRHVRNRRRPLRSRRRSHPQLLAGPSKGPRADGSRAHDGRAADAPSRPERNAVDAYIEFLGSHRKSARERGTLPTLSFCPLGKTKLGDLDLRPDWKWHVGLAKTPARVRTEGHRTEVPPNEMIRTASAGVNRPRTAFSRS